MTQNIHKTEILNLKYKYVAIFDIMREGRFGLSLGVGFRQYCEGEDGQDEGSWPLLLFPYTVCRSLVVNVNCGIDDTKLSQN